MVFGYLAWYAFQKEKINKLAKFLFHFVLSWLHIFGAIWSLSLTASKFASRFISHKSDNKELVLDMFLVLQAIASLLFIYYLCDINYYKSITLIGKSLISSITSPFNLFAPNIIRTIFIFFILPISINLYYKNYSIFLYFLDQLFPLALFVLLSSLIVYSGKGIFLTKYAAPTIFPCMLILVNFLNYSINQGFYQINGRLKSSFTTLIVLFFSIALSFNTQNIFKNSKFPQENIKDAVIESCNVSKYMGMRNVYVLTNFSISEKYIQEPLYAIYSYYFEKNPECNYHIFKNLNDVSHITKGALLVIHSSESDVKLISNLPYKKSHIKYQNISLFIFNRE
jgi:hypothetical protein